MATMFSRVFTDALGTNTLGSQQRHLPMINTVTNSAGSYLSQTNQVSRKKALMAWYKSIPELTGFVDKLARDITGRYKFCPVNELSSGRNKVKRAEDFSRKVEMRSVLKAHIIDCLATGEAFGWIGRLKEDQVKEVLNNIFKQQRIQVKAAKYELAEKIMLELKAESGKADMIDEDILRPRKYRYVPSSTVEVVHNQYDVLHYNHWVGTEQVEFMPDELIHFTLMDVDGKPNGFTPVESVLTQLELLRFMWQNMMSIHKNGGMPDKIISLENVQPNSPSYHKIEEQLQKYRFVENRHGMYLFTGKIQVEDLQQLDQMQFKDLGLYITGLIAMQWGIPKSAIPYIVGGASDKTDVGGDAERGYWECVRDMQKTFQETFNNQFWIPYFGVEMKFENSFVHRDIQKETYQQLMLGNLKVKQELLMSLGKKLSEEYLTEELDLEPDDLAEFNPETDFMATNNPMQNQIAKDNNSDAKNTVSDKKKSEQTQSAARKGKPSGMGKELDDSAELSYKEIIGKEQTDLDKDNFIRIYNQDKAYGQGMPPRVFMRSNPDLTSFIFKSTDFVYRYIANTDMIMQDDLFFMNFGNNIYRL